MSDIDQNRPPERRYCIFCNKNFKFGDKRIVVSACGWSVNEPHTTCNKKHDEQIAEQLNS